MKTKNCECCLMPMSRSPKPSGSDRYCSYCFVDGKLLADGVTLKEFQKKCFEGMKKQGHHFMMAHIFSYMVRFSPYWKQR